MIPWYILLTSMTLITIIGAFGAFYFKKASEEFSLHPLKLLKNWQFVLAGFLYVISTIGYVILLKHEDLTIMYPLASLQYVWVALLSSWLLSEKITGKKIVGIGFIIIGVSLITLLR